MADPIDRPALRALAEAADPGWWPHDARLGPVVVEPRGIARECDVTCHAPTPAVVLALLDALEEARADFIRHAEHKASCASYESRHDAAPVPCDCGYHEALARAEGR